MHWAVIAVALGIAFGNRTIWFKRSYNVAQISIAAAAGSVASWNLVRPGGLHQLDAVVWILGAVTIYFVVSSGLSTWIVALASHLPLQTTWWRTYRHTAPAMFGVLFIGVLIAVLWVTSPWTIALAAIPLTAVYYAIRNTVRLETQTTEALFNLADILDARDSYTHGHSLRVGQYAEKLALAMGLSGDDAHLVFLSGRLHDIGKCAIKNEVLLKPGPLSDEEREHMCIHPDVGSQMLSSFSLFKECARFVRGHHERWDGQGYPDKLQGETIPLGARIIAVADTYDAMTTTRPYRTALPLSEAKRRLKEGAGSQWDPRCISAFLKLLETTPLGQPEPTMLPVPTADAKAA
jgi:putative nucleotidyltransferase with HDIG domain